MKYIASCSFGKDSLAMLIKIKELGLPLDEVIYCEIMFNNEISGETPEMYNFIKKAEKILKDKYDITVKHIKGISFKEQFYKVKQRGKHIGDNYGFPYCIGAWCNEYLKMKPIRKYYASIKEPYKTYIGIAYDEPKRYERLDKEKEIAPLYDLKITEKEAMEICRKNDLLSPIYKTSFRGGCWFCVKQRLTQLEWLYKEHNELWRELRKMEKDSFNTFKPNYTLEQLENRFKSKYERIKIESNGV